MICVLSMHRFSETLEYCTYDSKQSQTTTEGGMFGNMFDEKKELFYPFKSIENLINASRMFDITDILGAFQFGPEDKTGILVSKQLPRNLRYEGLNEYWKPTLHNSRGFCFTFESKKYGKHKVLSKTNGDLLAISLHFDVSCHLILFIIV